MLKKQFGSKKLSKTMNTNPKNMKKQFGSKKMSKFMTANQKNMFLMFFSVFYNILHVKYIKKVEKTCFLLKNNILQVWE